jgi:hypothetical protein
MMAHAGFHSCSRLSLDVLTDVAKAQLGKLETVLNIHQFDSVKSAAGRDGLLLRALSHVGVPGRPKLRNYLQDGVALQRRRLEDIEARWTQKLDRQTKEIEAFGGAAVKPEAEVPSVLHQLCNRSIRWT